MAKFYFQMFIKQNRENQIFDISMITNGTY